MDGGMGLHSYIAQVDHERKHVIDELNRAKTQVPRISILHVVDPAEHSRVSVSAELRKLGQGFAWGQQWSPGAGPAQGVSSGRDNHIPDGVRQKKYSKLSKSSDKHLRFESCPP
ncbi:hypothetical protein MTR67_022012 [Solanum verrucosum]|uniref:Uncharacterized protein n=1 Tax=Solanum verrucosum TaxID=315347 RepID=A0AAF0TQ60_SOLVR|nr:hypothetical protein MTR67_022012 [Solanum verrucosum]